jgi:hypothetical protein
MEDTFTNESESAFSVGTPNTYHLNKNNTDPGFHQAKRAKKPRGHHIIEYYETPRMNDSRIRNAITGLRYRDDHPKCKYVVGSTQEDIFFKVLISTGEPEIYSRDNKKTTVLLFYDSPEQYERHQKMTLPQILKEKWQEKNRLRIIANRKYEEKDDM